jgi:DNA-binding NtrC family response regulator
MASILLIDDDKYFRKAVVPALQSRKHDVKEAIRCSDADALLAACKVDLVIIDGLLPDLDGVTWMERFRKTNQTTALIFCSAFYKNEPRLAPLHLAATLKKPVDVNALVAKVESVLRKTTAVATPEEELSEEAKQGLAALKAAFEADLPKLVNGVREAVAQLRRSPSSAPIRGVALRRAHQIAGTAGSFGFEKVGDACAQIEHMLRDLAAQAPTPELWTRLQQALDSLGYEPEMARSISA